MTNMIKGIKLNLSMKKTLRSIPYKIFRTIILFGLSFVIIYPLLKQGATVFMTLKDVNDPLVLWLPTEFTLTNIYFAVKMMQFNETIFTTLLYCTGMGLLQLISAAITAYGFARLQFPGSKLLFIGVLLTIIVPPQIIILPLYINFKNFDILGLIEIITGSPVNMIDSPISLFVLAISGMALRGGLFIYIFNQFFKGIPKAMEEASFIDGAGIVKTFVNIVLPNSRGAITTIGLFAFVWQYNDIYFTSIFFPRGKLISLKLIRISMSIREYLNQFLDDVSINPDNVNPLYESLIAGTAALITIFPLILLFFFVQRQLTEGVERVGLKG